MELGGSLYTYVELCGDISANICNFKTKCMSLAIATIHAFSDQQQMLLILPSICNWMSSGVWMPATGSGCVMNESHSKTVNISPPHCNQIDIRQRASPWIFVSWNFTHYEHWFSNPRSYSSASRHKLFKSTMAFVHFRIIVLCLPLFLSRTVSKWVNECKYKIFT